MRRLKIWRCLPDFCRAVALYAVQCICMYVCMPVCIWQYDICMYTLLYRYHHHLEVLVAIETRTVYAGDTDLSCRSP